MKASKSVFGLVLAVSLGMPGCFISGDDDDDDVIVDDDCVTTCDNDYDECTVSCSDNACTAACDSDRAACRTDC